MDYRRHKASRTQTTLNNDNNTLNQQSNNNYMYNNPHSQYMNTLNQTTYPVDRNYIGTNQDISYSYYGYQQQNSSMGNEQCFDVSNQLHHLSLQTNPSIPSNNCDVVQPRINKNYEQPTLHSNNQIYNNSQGNTFNPYHNEQVNNYSYPSNSYNMSTNQYGNVIPSMNQPIYDTQYTKNFAQNPITNSNILPATNNTSNTTANVNQFYSTTMMNGNITSSSSQSSNTFNDNMPNPINEQRFQDEKYKGTTICYRQYAEPPPSIYTEYYYKDEGISNPRYIRSTYYTIPSSNKIAKLIKIPIGIIAQPFASISSNDSPLISSVQNSDGPQRCEQCRAYVNPQSLFIDGGKTMLCNICGHKTNVMDEYFCYLDNSGMRLDRFSRPELFQGSYELSTNKLYCRNNTLPKPPIYLFMFNVSRNSITNGMLTVVADILSSIIPKHLPIDNHYIDTLNDNNNSSSYPCENIPPNEYNTAGNGNELKKTFVRVAFMAYDKRIYYFNVREHCHNKQSVEISLDINNPYIPSYKGFVVDPYDCSHQIQSLLQEIPKMFSNSNIVDTILGPVIENAISLIKSNGDCGRLFIFHSMLPTFNSVGKLENRDNNSSFGTENEINILKPQSNYYTKLAKECVENGISVNLFLTTAGYIDIATLGVLCDNTGGRIFYYPFFDIKRFGQQLAFDIKSFLTRPCGHDAYMKLRVSNSLRVTSIYGCFSYASTTDIQLGYIDSDTTIGFELEHDEDISKTSAIISFQLAILYTSLSGQRRLCIHNIYLKHSSEYMDIYRSLDCESIVCLLTKKYCTELLKQNNIMYVGDKLSEYTYLPLLSYIKHCKQSQSHFQQLILPESLKLYPLYMNSLIKSDAFLTRKELGQDGRSIAIFRCKSCSIQDLILELYPSIYNILDPINNQTIEELDQKTISISQLGIPTYRCIYEKLQNNQIYLMTLPHIIFMWVGSAVDPEIFRSLFGINSLEQIDGVTMEMLPAFDNNISTSVRQLINLLRKYHHPNRFIPISIVKQGGISENTFRHFLSESKSFKPKSFTYMEYLCFIHKSINENL